uniref:uncharacterized protein n=1 Tax=Myxine glutinosa TaxID=7769 RepID=UPI003590007E
MYIQGSFKSTAREKRGKGIRRRVTAANTIPGNWQEFLRLDNNKTELFEFLAHQVVENLSTEKEVYTTCGENVLCTRVNQNVSAMAPCSHEEADTRMFVHAMDAANRGHRRIVLRTVDTDVLVLAVSNAARLENTEIWVAFGTGKHFRYIPAHEIATSLGHDKARALPMFHAFAGCDTVSSFAGRGKKTAFDIWKSFPEVTPVFITLTETPSSFNEEYMSVLECFVVLLYDRTSSETSINAARQHMFSTKARSLDGIPPTSAALLQQVKRTVYQGGHIWGQSHVRVPEVPSPDAWGWKKSALHEWEPLWTLPPEAAMSCSELIKCHCVKGCRGQCKCVKANLKCTTLCQCRGDCDHNEGN